MLATELLHLFLRQRIVGKERNKKIIATANRRFYVVRNITQLKAVFAGKGINALPLKIKSVKPLFSMPILPLFRNTATAEIKILSHCKTVVWG